MKTERGATMLEFAIVGVVLFMLLIGLFEYGRFMSAKAVITAAADRAAALAASDILLDTTETSTAAINRATDIVASSFISTMNSAGSSAYLLNPVTIIPPGRRGPDGKISQKDLSNNPITVVIDACIVPLFPGVKVFFNSGGNTCGSNVPVRAVAAAYRESSKSASLPIETDCLGRAVGSPDFYQNCPCVSGKTWDPILRQCVCNNGSSASDCACAANQYVNPLNNLCMCNLGTASCSNPLYAPDSITCACACFAPARQASCTTPPYGFTPGTWDNTACGCTCPGTSLLKPSGNCQCPSGAQQTCTDKGPYWTMNNSCGCQCMAGRDSTCEASGGTWNSSTCTCGCAFPMREIYGECKCNQQLVNDCSRINQDTDPATCRCMCNDSARFACERVGGTFDTGSCGCRCPDGMQWDGWTYGGGMGRGCYDPNPFPLPPVTGGSSSAGPFTPPPGGGSGGSSGGGYSDPGVGGGGGSNNTGPVGPTGTGGGGSSEPCSDCGINE